MRKSSRHKRPYRNVQIRKESIYCSHRRKLFSNLPKLTREPNNTVKILHISDLHADNHFKLNTDLWDAIKTVDFHMVAITGDIILSCFKEFKPHMPYLEALAKNVPVFYVEGNHDVYDFEEIKREFTKIGVKVLDNERTDIKINNRDLCVIGTRDYYCMKSVNFKGLDNLFRDLNRNAFNLVLTHQPQIFHRIKFFRPDLVLSGHTHGGQVRLPLFPTLYAPAQGILPKYGEGWYSWGKSKLYVSRGIGVTYFPLRLFNPPEVSVISV